MRILFNDRVGKECRTCCTRPRVIDTRPTDTGYVYRRMKCECGQERTLEIPMSLYEGMEKQIADLKAQSANMQREIARMEAEAAAMSDIHATLKRVEAAVTQVPEKPTLLIDEPVPRMPPPRHVIDRRSMSI
jgi:hypothetical protein